MSNRLYALLLTAGLALTAGAQNNSYTILHEKDTTVKTQIEGITLGSRDVRYYRYEYPSKDADGKAVNISGAILVPSDIVSGNVPCDGVIMLNHHTIGNPSQAPSQGEIEAAGAMLSNPLSPNYIIVMSDYIGYGSSIDRPMCYLTGETNARNSLDGLLAARQLFLDKQIPQGKYLFNVGYSQGATETMYAAKLRDMEYKDRGITFDKTFAGGGMLDCERAYQEFVEKDQCDNVNDVAMFLISLNENYHLGIDYKDLFKEPLASNVEEFIKTKNKGVFSRIGVSDLDSLHQLLQPAYMNLRSSQAKALKAKLAEIKIANGWTPDVTQRYYIEHSRHDNYVPVQCARSLVTWMSKNGFTRSLVPGKTNLQTNLIVFKLKHQPSAIVWAIQTMVAIQLWPVAYYEGGLNRYYRDAVKDLNLMKVIKLLEGLGIDLRKADSRSLARVKETNAITANFFEILERFSSTLAKVDLTLTDLIEMLTDSGITAADLIEVVNYFTSKTANARGTVSSLEEQMAAPLYLPRLYEQTLDQWFKQGNMDIEYNKWGW